MKAGLIMLISEIKKQLERIDAQIETEKRIHEAWTRYVDCPMKTAVIHQSIGVIRGLEIAKEAMEYIIRQEEANANQMSMFPPDEWMIREEEMKKIANQIDNRGGMVRQIQEKLETRAFFYPDGSQQLKVKNPDGTIDRII